MAETSRSTRVGFVLKRLILLMHLKAALVQRGMLDVGESPGASTNNEPIASVVMSASLSELK
jgi:hypothetical protein